MAANFRIQRHSKHNIVYLNLVGDFDGTSAMELIHELKRHVEEKRKIYIRTCCLSSVAWFGEEVFRKRWRHRPEFDGRFVFTGRYGSRMEALAKDLVFS